MLNRWDAKEIVVMCENESGEYVLYKDVEKLLNEIRRKHNLLKYMATAGRCECDPDVGAVPCMKHAAQDIFCTINKAIGKEHIQPIKVLCTDDCPFKTFKDA